MATDAKTATVPEKKPKGKLKGLLLLAGIFLAGGGLGFGGSLFLGNPMGDAAASEEGASAEGEGEGEEGGEEKAAEGAKSEEAPKEGGHGAKAEGGHGAKTEAKTGGKAKKDSAKGREIYALGDFVVNLRGSGGGRVLRTEIQIEGNGAAIESCEARKAQLRDAVLTLASDYTYSDLEGLDGKMRLRDELLRHINGVLKPAKVDRLYFTAFVVQ